jgi:hypothetical protein
MMQAERLRLVPLPRQPVRLQRRVDDGGQLHLQPVPAQEQELRRQVRHRGGGAGAPLQEQ